MRNYRRILFYLLLLFMFSCDNNTVCSRTSAVTDADINGCVIRTIKGCRVLICKSKEGFNEFAVGYGGMVKEDCNCKFTD